MKWKIIITETFSKEFKKYKRDNDFINALNKKIKRFQENPNDIGGNLSGKLQGYKSTRLMNKFRIIFKINNERKEIQLIAIDHRKFDYKRF